jgi:hypothetical protein
MASCSENQQHCTSFSFSFPQYFPCKISECSIWDYWEGCCNLIASILESQDKRLQGDQDEGKRQIPTTFSDILLSDLPDKDKGAEVGFVFAGIRKYIKNSGDLIGKKTARLRLVMDTVLAGLTGVPDGGVAFAAIQPGLDYMANKHKDRKLETKTELIYRIGITTTS